MNFYKTIFSYKFYHNNKLVLREIYREQLLDDHSISKWKIVSHYESASKWSGAISKCHTRTISIIRATSGAHIYKMHCTFHSKSFFLREREREKKYEKWKISRRKIPFDMWEISTHFLMQFWTEQHTSPTHTSFWWKWSQLMFIVKRVERKISYLSFLLATKTVRNLLQWILSAEMTMPWGLSPFCFSPFHLFFYCSHVMSISAIS